MSKDSAYNILSGTCKPQGSEGGFIQDDSHIIAFYLPQYHRIKENSEWWGPGFTEWTNVVKGRPNFEGHYQPHIPRELGFYDLSHPSIMEEQALLARSYGVTGFCFYHYWFSGRRILEAPVDNFLNTNIDIEFCLCWANENWTRTWSGDEASVLLGQSYTDEDDESFITSLLPYLKDPRYITVAKKPLLLVYRAKHLPDARKSFEIWRRGAKAAGLPGLHIAVVDFYDISHPNEVGADALVEFPPHKFNGPQSRPDVIPEFTNTDFTGGIVDYHKIVAQSAKREASDFLLYRGVIPSWDNTARRQNTPTVVVNSDPEVYGAWLQYVRSYTRVYRGKERGIIFINAWNEWGEGCHLEPDQRWGLQYLEQTLKSSYLIDGESLNHRREELYQLVAGKIVEKLPAAIASNIPEVAIVDKLKSYQPMGGMAHRVALMTLKWPAIYKAARFFYRTYRKVFG